MPQHASAVLQLQCFGSFSVESKAIQIVVSLLGRFERGGTAQRL